MESRVDLYARIRRDARVDELSIRELSRRHGVARQTVRAALARAEPLPRKVPERSSPRLDPFKAAIDQMLTDDLTAPRKQRHTARRVLARLADEHGTTELSYSTVRDYVARRRGPRSTRPRAGQRTHPSRRSMLRVQRPRSTSAMSM